VHKVRQVLKGIPVLKEIQGLKEQLEIQVHKEIRGLKVILVILVHRVAKALLELKGR
jgi:hypothetical protein